jgi:hypothetical protein
MDKIQKIKDLYAEDKLIQNVPDYSLNEFFGTIQIGVKDIENKSLKVTRNPNNRYVVYDGNKELGYLDNSKGTVFYDDSMFSRFKSMQQAARGNSEKKQELENILKNPNMSYFPIEEIDLTTEERNEIFRNTRGKASNLVLNYYKKQYGDNLISINFNGELISINFNGRNDQNDFNQILIGEFHSAYNKFSVILAEFVLSGQLKEADDVINFKASLLKMIEDKGENNIDETLNGMNVEQIIDEYGDSLATEEDAMIDRIFKMERTESSYTVVKVDSFEKASQYNKYLSSNKGYVSNNAGQAWCVTGSATNFNHYVDLNGETKSKGEVFYFLLKEPDWNEFKKLPPREQRDPFDDYGTSMIAVSIKPNGMINTATSRYNHDLPGKYSDTDHIFSEEDISILLGKPIFEALPSSTPFTLKEKEKDRSEEVIKKGFPVLTSNIGNRKIIQYQGSYYLFLKNTIFKDKKSNKLFQFSNIKKIKKTSDSNTGGYLLYYSISDGDNKRNFVIGLDTNLSLIISSKKVGEPGTSDSELAKKILQASALEVQ